MQFVHSMANGAAKQWQTVTPLLNCAIFANELAVEKHAKTTLLFLDTTQVPDCGSVRLGSCALHVTD